MPTTSVGSPPQHLSADPRRCWAEFVSEGAQWLTGADRSRLQVASVLMSEFETNPTGMLGVKIAQLRGILNDLGFSPTSRTRINAPRPTRSEPNPFEQFPVGCRDVLCGALELLSLNQRKVRIPAHS